MSKVAETFVQEFVIGFGFLSGLWIHVGVDPEGIVFDALLSVINNLSPTPLYSAIFSLIPIALTGSSIIASYLVGGKIPIRINL